MKTVNFYGLHETVLSLLFRLLESTFGTVTTTRNPDVVFVAKPSQAGPAKQIF